VKQIFETTNMPVFILSNHFDLEKVSQNEGERRYGFGKETTNAIVQGAQGASGG
jgi:hypothetical protein